MTSDPIDPAQWLEERGWSAIQLTPGGELHWKHPEIEAPDEAGPWSLEGAVDEQLKVENARLKARMGF